MASVLLSYDIKKTSDTIHSQLKQELINTYGYSPKIESDAGNWYDLPNTCLRRENTSREQSSKDFLQACIKVGAKWEKYIAAEYSRSTFANQIV
jgi:hypothetical protein